MFTDRQEHTCSLAEEMVAKLMGDQSICPTGAAACAAAPAAGSTLGGCIYDTVGEAIAAAKEGYLALNRLTLAERGEMIDAIRRAARRHAEELSRIELEETGMGRYEDKVRKLLFTIEKTPGVEDIKPEACAGDMGLTVVEHIPFGVVCCITPSTGPVGTPFHNAICMIAAGNSVVFSPHPNAMKCSLMAIGIIQEAILEVGGPANIICCLSRSSLDITNQILDHPDIKMVVATGGPSVVQRVLSSGKKAIGAGAGNPPAMVDETANLANAAQCIVAGSHFENGIQCIGEKEIVVVDAVADRLMDELVKAGAYLLRSPEDIDRLTQLVTTPNGPSKDFNGKDPAYILEHIGIHAPADTKAIIFEAPRDHIIAVDEYLMSILPIIRAKDSDEAIELSAMYEGGRRHTAVIHSQNVSSLSKYVKAVGCTIVVKNGPSYAGLGIGGEGYMTATVAGPTGEGLTSPKTFTRQQRCVLVGDFNLRGTYPL